MARALLLVALVLVVAAPASAGVDRGTILPGKGLTTVKLGTRTDEARKALGKPTGVVGRVWNWDGRQVRVTVRFDTSGYADRVQVQTLTTGVTGVCTTSTICLGAPGGVQKLKALHGAKLKPTKTLGGPAWLLLGKGVLGQPVYTAFAGFPGTTRIISVAVGYCYGTTLC